MDLPALLADLRRRGCRVYLVAGRPKLDHGELLTPADWAQLKAHAAGLVAALTAETAETAETGPPWLYREMTINGVRCVIYGTPGELGDNVRLARRCPLAFDRTALTGLEKVFLDGN